MSDHSSDCGEMSFEEGAICDKNGNISFELRGFVCNYKSGPECPSARCHTEKHNVPKGMVEWSERLHNGNHIYW